VEWIHLAQDGYQGVGPCENGDETSGSMELVRMILKTKKVTPPL
jgi:hypothetical protein